MVSLSVKFDQESGNTVCFVFPTFFSLFLPNLIHLIFFEETLLTSMKAHFFLESIFLCSFK